MADDVTIAAVGGNRTVATDEIGGKDYQRIKVAWGPDDTANMVDTATGKPFPIQLRGSTGDEILLATQLGATNETAPATDTATAGLNGRLQRIAVHLGGALSTYHLICSSGTNAASIKSGAGTLRSVHLFNNAGYPIFAKFHNTTGAPTPGSGVVFTAGVQSGVSRDLVLPRGGRSFTNGIGISVVQDMSDTGTTAVELRDAAIEVCYE